MKIETARQPSGARLSRALCSATTCLAILGGSAAFGQDQPEITIAINQSPWLDSFVEMVDLYEKQTGNVVELDVSPFGGLLEKIRNSVRADTGTFELVNINALWLSEIYSAGYLEPLSEIRDGYKLQDGVLNFDYTTHWDAPVGSFSSKGDLLGVPINGNVQVLYYNQEVYDKLGIEVPTTWDQLNANAAAIAKSGDTYGFVPRAARNSIVYNFTPYLFSHGAAFLDVTAPNEVSVAINSAKGLAALETYLSMSGDVAPPNAGAIAQGELIQLISTGKAAQGIAVIAAWGALEDPNQSRVVGKMNAALIPSGPNGESASSAGHWVVGVPGNISDERQAAAIAFLDWFQTTEVQVAYVEAGGVPVRGDLSETKLGDDPAYRFLDAYSQNADNAVMGLPITQAAEASDAIALSLNKAVIGEMSAVDALNQAAADLAAILERDGNTVSRLPDL